ncbi:MAG TPA: ATP-binding protein [Tepidisphaeraceae bacterium]|jgi:CheY-like chemotaxis protein
MKKTNSISTVQKSLPSPTDHSVSESDRLLDAERNARVESERAGRVKDEFLANLSHELRTPINAILGWSQLIKPGESSDADVAEAMEVIQRNARVQAQLIDDLLDMSRVVSGKMRLDVQRVELPVVIDAALESVRPAADVKNIRVEKIIDPLAGPVTGDPARLQQIIWNILSNALKFTDKGGKVQIVLERVNSHLDLSVSDDGAGISAAFLPYVFDRLSQADHLPGRKYHGLGVGLAIVKSLTELHGGTVRVKSAGLGLGSTFIISLPVSILHAKPDSEDQHHPESQRDLCPPYAPHLNGVRVLIVDDDTDAVELVKRVLKNCDAQVTTAASGAEGLKLLQQECPDVVLADVGMPGMNGYEFVKQVRGLEMERARNTPVVALTALARSEDRRRAMLAGFDLHVAKPAEPAELVAVVGRLARRV